MPIFIRVTKPGYLTGYHFDYSKLPLPAQIQHTQTACSTVIAMCLKRQMASPHTLTAQDAFIRCQQISREPRSSLGM